MKSPMLQSLYLPVADELAEVREGMEALWNDALKLLQVDIDTSPEIGGKLLRPALCLLSAGAIGATNLSHYTALATVFETLHVASLTHDDVIDRAILRRGKHALNAVWGDHAAILGGDYLVARAVEMMEKYDNARVITHTIQSVRLMAEGELHYFGWEFASLTHEDCIILAEKKTASLFAQACCASTYLIAPQWQPTLHRFGTSLGIAFQLVDDLLDLSQPSGELGKPACNDIVEGKTTLPILHLLESMSGPDAAHLRSLPNTLLSEDDRVWIANQLIETGAAQKTEATARQYADDALAMLAELPPTPYRESMEGLMEFILIRHS